MKKFAAMLLVALMLVSALASTVSAKNAVARVNDAEAVIAYPVDTDETLTIWRYVDGDIAKAGYTTYNEAPGFLAWQEQTGIKAVVEESADKTALLLRMASDTLPDIILSNKNDYQGGPEKLLSDMMILDLTDMLPEYAPAYNALINSDEVLNNCVTSIVDGEKRVLAFAGNFYPQDSPYRNYAGMMIRADLQEQLGMDAIETADDFYTFLSRCKNELGIETPLMSQNTMNEYLWKEGLITNAFGLISGTGYHVDGKYHYGAFEPEYKDVLTYLNKLYNEGLFDPNFASTDNDTAIAAMTSGKSAAIACMVSRFQVVLSATEIEGFDLTAIQPLTANKGEVAEYGYISPAGGGNSFWTFVTADSKNPELAMQFLDYPFTEAGLLLADFGTEGVSFEYNEEGKPAYTDLIKHNPDGVALDPMLRAYGLLNWPTIHLREMSENRFPYEQQTAGVAIWAKSNADAHKIYASAIPEDLQNEAAMLETDLTTYVAEMTANFISGVEPLDNFDAYIDNLKSIGSDRYVEIMQMAIDPYYGN